MCYENKSVLSVGTKRTSRSGDEGRVYRQVATTCLPTVQPTAMYRNYMLIKY